MVKKIIYILYLLLIILFCSCANKNNVSIESFENTKANTTQNNEPNNLKDLVLEKTNLIALSIENKDMEQMSKFVHPIKGLRFSNYGYVDIKNDVVVSKDEMNNFLHKEYEFRYFDELDDMPSFKESGLDYFNKRIYFSDFSQAKLGYNKRVELENYPTLPGNHFDVYKNAVIIELYFENHFPEQLDWKIIRFVFECYNNDWLLVGIVNDEWTP